MSNNNTILPDSIAIYPHLLAFDVALKNQVDSLPLQVLLVYLVDNVPAAALPFLAAQFDVLGYKGLALCQTEQDQRNLIKEAIELHRFKGTQWAVKQALKSIGFADVKIVEHTSGNWATFKVILTNENLTLTEQTALDLVQMVYEYKGCRNALESVQLTIQVEDIIDLETDTAGVFAEIHADDTVTLTGSLFYDGVGLYDGLNDYSSDNDVVTITEI
jgi:phage tail P2-like protein